MAGNQSRGLIQASITRGWDPRVIPGFDSGILPNFDKDQGNIVSQGNPSGCLGKLPDGTPDGWPDGHDILGVPSPSPTSRDFQPAPQASGNNPKRTNGANPYPGFGGEGY